MDAAANSYRRFLDGDESAFEEIMQELFCGLVFFINGFVHDPHAAEDIAIDSFSDLVVHRHRYNFRVSLKTYLYMVGRSRALDYLRRRRILRFTELSEAHGLADDSAALEELALAGDRQRRVNAALAQLPRRELWGSPVPPRGMSRMGLRVTCHPSQRSIREMESIPM